MNPQNSLQIPLGTGYNNTHRQSISEIGFRTPHDAYYTEYHQGSNFNRMTCEFCGREFLYSHSGNSCSKQCYCGTMACDEFQPEFIKSSSIPKDQGKQFVGGPKYFNENDKQSQKDLAWAWTLLFHPEEMIGYVYHKQPVGNK